MLFETTAMQLGDNIWAHVNWKRAYHIPCLNLRRQKWWNNLTVSSSQRVVTRNRLAVEMSQEAYANPLPNACDKVTSPPPVPVSQWAHAEPPKTGDGRPGRPWLGQLKCMKWLGVPPQYLENGKVRRADAGAQVPWSLLFKGLIIRGLWQKRKSSK